MTSSHAGRQRAPHARGLVWSVTLRVVALGALLSAIAAVSTSRTRPAAADTDLVRSVLALPADCHVVIAVRNPAARLATPQGRALASMLVKTGLVTRKTVDAWELLARSLRLTPEEAFDRLFGSRLILVSRRNPERAGTTPFVLVSEIDRGDARDLLKSLRVNPRSEIRGIPWFAGERGKFKLAITGKDRSRRLLLLALDEAGPLFDDLVAGLGGGAPTTRLGDTPIASAIDRFESSEVLALRRSPAPDSPGRPWSRFSALGASATPEGWTARIELRPASPQAIASAGWPAGTVDRLDDDAALALLTSVSPIELDQTRALFGADMWDPFGKPFSDLVTGRIALVVRAPTPGADPADGAVSLGIESPQPVALAAAMDRFIAGALTTLRHRSGLPEPVADFQGEHPAAVRVVGIEGDPAVTLRDLVGPSPTATWALCAAPHTPRSPAWFTAGVSGSSDEWPVRWMCDRLQTVPTNRDQPARLSEGVLRPRLLERWARWAGAMQPTALEAIFEPFLLSGVAEIRWTLWPDQDAGRLLGDIDIKVDLAEQNAPDGAR